MCGQDTFLLDEVAARCNVDISRVALADVCLCVCVLVIMAALFLNVND